MKIAGLDYSMTSPAICYYNDADGDLKFSNCRSYYLTQNKKYDIMIGNIVGKYFDYNDEMSRYETISTFFLNGILERNIDYVFIEDYSLGSRGRVFNIAENTGILKYRLWKYGVKYVTVPPTVIKKFATGKGNSDKSAMQKAFMEENSLDIKYELKMTEKQWNPSSDIIDSYWICKYGHDTITQRRRQHEQ